MNMKRKPTVKAPPRGGDAAAAWEHHLKPEDKEQLAEQYRTEQARKMNLGKTVVLLIVAVNAVLAFVSIFTGFNAILFGARVLMCIALFLGAPGIKPLFAAGALVSVIIISGNWLNPGDAPMYRVVFNIIDSACLIVSSLILFVDENVSDYLYMKRNG